MMSKEDGRVDWSEPAADVANLIRGVNPWPGGFTFHDDDRIKLHLARPVEGDGRPGEIIVADKKLVVAAGAGAVDCLKLQAPGKRAMDALDFLNGYELHPGEVLA